MANMMKSAAVSMCFSLAQASSGNNNYDRYGAQRGREPPVHERYGNAATPDSPYPDNRNYNYDARDPYYNQRANNNQAAGNTDPYYNYGNNNNQQAANNNYGANANANNNNQADPYKYQGSKYNDMYDDHDDLYDDWDREDTWNHEAPKPVKDEDTQSFNAQVEEEFKQDFVDFDLNRDNVVDPLEVRSHFQNEVSADELAQFWYDVDLDNSGTITWPEYREYAKIQYGSMEL